MSQVTSTKPSQKGTFGTETINCLYDGSTMKEYNKIDVGVTYQQIILRCPQCGWLATFLKRKE